MKNTTTIILVVVALVIVVVAILLLAGDKSSSNSKQPPASGAADTSNGLQMTDVTVGTGTEAAAGDTVTVSYVGSFPDGRVFDASANHGGSFSFVLGAGEVIKGWDEGVLGMKVGGERKLVVPPSLGYGASGTPGGPIPPNATLDFDIKLLNVQK